ncbi:hypothetical protein GBAR_LOCUS12557 [Geodia barretti]|uniref:Uncharacterized protein n=1 Tax=Geodia barretti TaxID=519541 RepID=A0AA35S0C5_GEOBA|nr:hypothetical protein GBAR_LOCUS12557 [Geodia barretti]
MRAPSVQNADAHGLDHDDYDDSGQDIAGVALG